jgi:CubicO group peptidase (beta-lactamase class C family)
MLKILAIISLICININFISFSSVNTQKKSMKTKKTATKKASAKDAILKESTPEASIQKILSTKSVLNFVNHYKTKESSINSIYFISKEGNGILKDSSGYRNFENKELLRTDEQMPIASGTKTMTSALILKLKEAGLLELSDPISKFLNDKSYYWGGKMPEWADDVTIHHLLTHSSGISEYLGQIKVDIKANQRALNKIILTHIAQKPLEFNPGDKYSYNNSGYVILGLILEQVHQKKLSKVFYDEIFKPLNMKNSRVADIKEAIAYNSNELAQYPTRYFVSDDQAHGTILTKIKTPIMLIPNGDGGVISSIDDLNIWAQSLHFQGFLNEESYKLMTTVHIEDKENKNGNIGYGIYIRKLANGKTVYQHGGNAIGIRSEIGVIKEDKVSIVMLSNVQKIKNKCNSHKCNLDVEDFNYKLINHLSEY